MENNTTPKRKTNTKFLIGFIALLLVGGTYGYIKYQHAQKHEETEDAQIEGNISPIIPRVGGFIAEVRVKDNQRVKKGDTLLVLDDRDLQVKLAQAQAALSIAESNLTVASAATEASRTGITTASRNEAVADAQIEAAKVRVWRATQDYNRYANLVKDHSITQQQFEQAEAEKLSAEKQLQILQEQRKAAGAQTNVVSSQSNTTGKQVAVANANILQRKAELDAAALNLSYTIITAPVDGVVSRVSLQPGQMVQPGQTLMNVVVNSDVWVVANFKETQLEKMKLGQEVSVAVDAFPGHHFLAKVTSFSPATGSRFALLPPDNASGNFVKTVQRVPVKIEFTKADDAMLQQLRPGMNVTADVLVK